jgi:hypothetical protein
MYKYNSNHNKVYHLQADFQAASTQAMTRVGGSVVGDWCVITLSLDQPSDPEISAAEAQSADLNEKIWLAGGYGWLADATRPESWRGRRSGLCLL